MRSVRPVSRSSARLRLAGTIGVPGRLRGARRGSILAGFENVKSVAIAWPATHSFATKRHHEGYKDKRIFPLSIVPQDPAPSPVLLRSKATTRWRNCAFGRGRAELLLRRPAASRSIRPPRPRTSVATLAKVGRPSHRSPCAPSERVRRGDLRVIVNRGTGRAHRPVSPTGRRPRGLAGAKTVGRRPARLQRSHLVLDGLPPAQEPTAQL